MKITSYRSNNVTILRLGGRFDAQTASLVRQLLKEAIATSSGKLVVNLAEVSFIDSSGLAVLVQSMRRCKKQNGNLHLCNFPVVVQIIFEATRVYNAFQCFIDEASAISAFKGKVGADKYVVFKKWRR